MVMRVKISRKRDIHSLHFDCFCSALVYPMVDDLETPLILQVP